ncbi:MAG: hypothetical protein WBB74_04110 [Gaiellaceae bacterium]
MSHVTSGAVLTLVIPLSLLVVILGIWAVAFRRAIPRRSHGEISSRDG